MLKKQIHFLLKHPKKVMAIYLAVLLAVTLIASNLEIEPRFSVLVPEDSEFNTNNRILESTFARNDNLLIFYELNENTIVQTPLEDLQDSLFLDHNNYLTQTLLKSQYVQSVSELEFSENNLFAAQSISLLVPNKRNEFQNVESELNQIIDDVGHPPQVEMTVTGFPVVLNRVSTLLIQDNLKTIIITLVLIFAVLAWYFKSYKIALVGIAAPVTSLMALAAAMVKLDIAVSITLAAVGVLMLGLGADYTIHLIATYERLLKKHSPRQAIEHAIDELELPITASFITTLAGFAALMLGISPSSIAQGTVLAIGITFVYATTMLVIPVLLLLFVPKSHTHSEQKFIKGLDSFISTLSLQITKHPARYLLITLALTVVFIIGASQVQFSTSNSNWIPDNDPVSVAFDKYIYVFQNTDVLTLVIQSTNDDLRNVQTVRDLQELQVKLENINSVEVVESPFADLPLDQAQISDILTNQKADKFNRDFTVSTMALVSEQFDVDGEITLVLEEYYDIMQTTDIYHAKISPHGDAVRFKELGDSLQKDTGQTSLIGFVLVFVVSALIYNSAIVGATALFPVVLGIIWAVGLMGFFGVPFTSLSTGIISLVLGIGVDFSIHIVNSIKNQLNLGKTTNDAIEYGLKTTGGAIILSSITTFLGFMALSFATLLGTKRLGWSLALSIVAVLLISLLLVPTIIALQEKYLSKKESRQTKKS